MSAFGLPPAPAAQLPEEVEVELIKSLNAFRARFGMFSGMAVSNGWIDDYAGEIRRIAGLAYKHGRTQGQNDCGCRTV